MLDLGELRYNKKSFLLRRSRNRGKVLEGDVSEDGSVG